MLKITLQPTPRRVTLKLEGSLIGAWVAELEQSWRDARCRHEQSMLCLDLAAVDRVDQAGRYLLALMAERGTQLAPGGLVTTAVVAEIVEDWQLGKPESDCTGDQL